MVFRPAVNDQDCMVHCLRILGARTRYRLQAQPLLQLVDSVHDFSTVQILDSVRRAVRPRFGQIRDR